MKICENRMYIFSNSNCSKFFINSLYLGAYYPLLLSI